MSKLTKEQKDYYLKNPDECPHCHSVDITVEFPDFYIHSCIRNIKCNEENCNKK